MYTQTHINPFWIHHVHLASKWRANKLVFTNSDMYVHTHTEICSLIFTHTHRNSFWVHVAIKRRANKPVFLNIHMYIHTHKHRYALLCSHVHTHTHKSFLDPPRPCGNQK